MDTFCYETGGNEFTCRVSEALGGIEIVSFQGNSARLFLPESVSRDGQEWELAAIGKKAFLGCRGLRSVTVPKTVKRIGDWAFSQCRQLEGILVEREKNTGESVLRENNMVKASSDRRTDPDGLEFGTGVFTDCPNMSYLAIGVPPADDLAVLLGAVIHRLPSEDLLRDSELGSRHWYQKWDLRLQSFLNEDDEEGYTDIVLCGEEDIIKSVPEYRTAKRRRKSSLCMLRLLHARLLSGEAREIYVNYLLSHTKGCATEEAWEAVMSEHGENLEYYQLFADVGGICADNIDSMIQDLDAPHAEAKAFLIRYKQEHFATEDVFGMFAL